MKKVFLMMAVAAFFSMGATSCGEEKAADENSEEGHDHEEGEEEHAH